MKAIFFAVIVLAFALVIYFTSKSSISTHKPVEITNTSSYEQTTNHFKMPSYDLGPIQGSESPFRVNQFLSYQV